MLQPPIDMRTGFKRNRLIFDIAGDPRTCFDRQLADRYRALDPAGDAGVLGTNLALDEGVGPDHQAAAIEIAFDPTLDVQIGRSALSAQPDWGAIGVRCGGLLVLAVACVAVSVATFRSYQKNV